MRDSKRKFRKGRMLSKHCIVLNEFMKRTRKKRMATYCHFKIKYGLSLILVCFCIKNTAASCNADGRFGPDCEFSCHCMDNKQCDRITGDCPSGCAFGWVGPACQRKNIVFRETSRITRHSSTRNGRSAKFAIDKNLSTCSITTNSSKPWWRLWLPSKHNIRNMSLLTLNSYLDHFKEFKVMVENNTEDENNTFYSEREICYTHGDYALSSTNIDIGCNKTLFGNQIRIQLASNNLRLVLCDVRIFGECTDGTFGVTCTEKCRTHCEDVCDKDNGTCTSCHYGWTGRSCNQECYETTAALYKGYRNKTADGIKCQRWDSQYPHNHRQNIIGKFPDASITEAANFCRDPDGEGSPWCYTTDPNIRWQFCGLHTCNMECSEVTYGVNCANNCSQKCRNSMCSTVSGVCNEGCIPGYKGNYCQNSCWSGFYGMDCKQSCSEFCFQNESRYCSHINGRCLHGCQAGWQGINCTLGCTDGTYGKNCTKNCSRNCKNSVCDRVSGGCNQGCQPGYKGIYCNETCDDGFFGLGCLQKCSQNCVGGYSNCDNVFGSCLSGCTAGWKGRKCDEVCATGDWGLNCANSCGHCISGVCRHTDGVCNGGCAAGFKLTPHCDEKCDNGTYGINCSRVCSSNCKDICSKQSGECDFCKRGWYGTKCTRECDEGKWGENCKRKCATCHNHTCDRFSGACKGQCKLGFKQTEYCDEECSSGWYGTNCSKECNPNCKDAAYCRKTDGVCLECKHGMEGIMCEKAVQQADAETNVNISGGGLSGIFVTFVVLIFISVVVTVLVMKRRLQAHRSHNTFENETVAYSNGLAAELHRAEATDTMYDSIKRKSGTEHIYE